MIDTSPLLSVTELTATIKKILESGFSTLHIQGEISNFKHQSSGHYYFSLKDENASIACVMFRQEALKFAETLKDGESVSIKGSLTVYPQSGKYQIIVKEVQRTGLGDLLLKLEQLKVKLHRLGWFKQTRKKSLPKMPKRIGIVTSPTGAVIQDILKVLKRRFSGLHIYLNPVRVQGEGAAAEIAKAIHEFNRLNLVDVMIVGRGGGSVEDLFAFNEEIVAAAIYESKIPIICAVGHETDHCIAEYVADVRAPTPSAAAEMVIAEKISYEKALRQMEDRLSLMLRIKVKRNTEKLKSLLKLPKLKNPLVFINTEWQKIDDLSEDLQRNFFRFQKQKKLELQTMKKRLLDLRPISRLSKIREKKELLQRSLQLAILNYFKRKEKSLIHVSEKMDHQIQTFLQLKRLNFQTIEKQKQIEQSFKRLIISKERQLTHYSETIKAINPKKLLSKGFTILFSEKDGSVIKSVHALQKNENFRLLLKDGEAEVKVENVMAHP